MGRGRGGGCDRRTASSPYLAASAALVLAWRVLVGAAVP